MVRFWFACILEVRRRGWVDGNNTKHLKPTSASLHMFLSDRKLDDEQTNDTRDVAEKNGDWTLLLGTLKRVSGIVARGGQP
jgi:hypothetical protein